MSLVKRAGFTVIVDVAIEFIVESGLVALNVISVCMGVVVAFGI